MRRLVLLIAASAWAACGLEPDGTTSEPGASAAPPAGIARPPGWSEQSHGKDGPPRYDLGFPQGTVSRLDLKIAPADWQAMQDDLASMLGRFGAGGWALPEPGSVNFIPRTPLYVAAQVGFGGRTWHHVGVRFRGNYTLAQTWKSGRWKLPLRLDFDRLEDRFPAIRDQRFFGVKAVALVANQGDPSMLREKVAGDLFRLAGVPAGRTAFYRVFIDHGSGPVYFGLYTAVEIPHAALARTFFGEWGGNLYKPEGSGAKLGAFDPAHFEKKTNEKAGDFGDVQALLAALHAPRKDATAWRAGLERAFAVDGFLRYLAVNELVQNWDTYGVVPHNYYLYGVPREGGRLHWIPWDNSNAFDEGFLFWKTPPLTLWTVGADWPLIRFLADDPVYRAAYLRHLRAVMAGPFALDPLLARLRAEHALVAPFVTGPEGERPGHTLLAKPADFAAELQKIVDVVTRRHQEAERVLRAAP